LLPHKIGEAADRFHRYRLIKKVYGLIAVHPEKPPEMFAVLAEIFIEHLYALCIAQFFSQIVDICKTAEMLGDRERRRADDEQLFYFSFFTYPENLRQTNIFIIPGIMKISYYYSIRIIVGPQINFPGYFGDLFFFFFVFPPHIA
jgi:hypothetical protein